MKTPQTLLEAVRAFKDPNEAQLFFANLRWPHGAACPREGCGSMDVRFIAGKRPRWFCKDCEKEFTAKVGTVFEDSPIGFDKWLPAIWLLTSAKNGISSLELSRSLGVTQKTAWFMEHRIRLAMRTGTFHQLRGHVEADETYIGGRKRGPNSGRASGRKPKGPQAEKTSVMGIIERKGEIRAFVVPDARADTLVPRVIEHVAPGSTIYTDELRSYHTLKYSYIHEVINHAEAFVRANVHTNSVENFWSVLKRTLAGTYIAPRPKHIDRYLDEQVFRFNSREAEDGARFAVAAKAADRKRLTYKALVGK